MAEQDRKQTQRGEGDEEQVAQDEAVAERGDEITEKIDDLLDEIDSVLEENAEEFVKNYVQKGGE